MPSLPVRGAWIEMGIDYDRMGDATAVAPRAGSVD